MNYIGIDPGQSGAMALLDNAGQIIEVHAFKKLTYMDTYSILARWSQLVPVQGMIEKVHSMPKQGVVSSFKFGEHYGFLQGILTASHIPYQYVTPQKWMKRLDCRTGGNKNISKARAQQQWPQHKMTHAVADALLIAEYCRLVHTNEMFT